MASAFTFFGKRRHMKRFFLYSGLVVLILLMLIFTVGLWLKLSTASRVAEQRAAIAAAGDRVYLTEYAREPIPNEENAYYFLKLAKVDLEAIYDKLGKLGEVDLQRRLRPDQIAALEKLVEEHTKRHRTFELLEKAAACTQYDSQTDYSQGVAVELPDMVLLRSAARAIEAKALVLAYHGEGDDALAECERWLRLNALFQNDPLIINHLVSIACQSIGVSSANHVLRVAETSPDARQRLDAVLATLDNRRAGVEAMKGERAWGVLTFEQLRSGKLDPQSVDAPPVTRLLAANWIGQAYLNDDEAKYLELMDRHIQAAELDGSEREAFAVPIDVELQNGGVRHVMTRLLVPALKSALAASDRADTYNHCLRVLLALQDRDDAALGDLGLPDAATRDAGGLPLVIRHTDDGWVVYGVGKNGVDDGGKVDTSDGEPLDIGLAPLGEALTPGEVDDVVDSH